MSGGAPNGGSSPLPMGRRWLTRRELTVLGELLAIVLFSILLVLSRIAFSIPADQFIYGRF